MTKLGNREMLTNDHGKSEEESDICEELIKVETDEIALNEGTNWFVTSVEINEIVETNQNKIWNK